MKNLAVSSSGLVMEPVTTKITQNSAAGMVEIAAAKLAFESVNVRRLTKNWSPANLSAAALTDFSARIREQVVMCADHMAVVSLQTSVWMEDGKVHNLPSSHACSKTAVLSRGPWAISTLLMSTVEKTHTLMFYTTLFTGTCILQDVATYKSNAHFIRHAMMWNAIIS